MPERKKQTFSYFPGCSLATSARENNSSLILFFKRIGVDLIELDDWNCCGSSSAHSIDAQMAQRLPARNLSLAPPGRALMVACPSCYLRLKQCQMKLKKDPAGHRRAETRFGRKIDTELDIVHYFEVLDRFDIFKNGRQFHINLNGLRCAPYYGCMLARPPEMRYDKIHYGLMEKIIQNLGGEPVRWAYASRCCGTFLSVVRPDVVTGMVNQIVFDAGENRADCIVTACAMCHLNLELRCRLSRPIPVMHFSELLSLAMGAGFNDGWFERHLIDPRPMLKSKHLI